MGVELIFVTIAFFGGIAGIIGANGWAKAERIRAEASAGRRAGGSEDAVLAEIKALKQQMADMQNTSHQFDMSFDAALTRLEERVSRLETRNAPRAAAPDLPATLRTGAR
jgi:hypothetical protein